MIREVIKKDKQEEFVVANQTKESKRYIMITDSDIYMLHRMIDSRWTWMSLRSPIIHSNSYGFDKFIHAIDAAFNLRTMKSVHEIETTSDLIEFLKDRGEDILGKI